MDPQFAQGLVVVVLAAGERRGAPAAQAERVLDILLAEHSPSDAARIAARITGLPKKDLYRKALQHRKVLQGAK